MHRNMFDFLNLIHSLLPAQQGRPAGMDKATGERRRMVLMMTVYILTMTINYYYYDWGKGLEKSKEFTVGPGGYSIFQGSCGKISADALY